VDAMQMTNKQTRRWLPNAIAGAKAGAKLASSFILLLPRAIHQIQSHESD
jgi:hypothetical protein